MIIFALLLAISYAQTGFRRQLETSLITECVNDEIQAEAVIAPTLPLGVTWNGCQTVAGQCNLDVNIPLLCCETCSTTEPSVSPTTFPSTAESACPKWILANERETCHEACAREEIDRYCTEEFWPETEREFLHDVLPALDDALVCDIVSLGPWGGNPTIFMTNTMNKCYWGLNSGIESHGRCQIRDEDDGGDFRVCCCTNEQQPVTTGVPKTSENSETDDLIAAKWWFWVLIFACLFAITAGTFYIVKRRVEPIKYQEEPKQQHLPDASGSVNYVVEIGLPPKQP